MIKTKIDKKNEEIKHLDAATQAIIQRLNKSDTKLRVSGFVAVILLLAVGIAGILYQNHIANQNKQHIDCIVKLFTTPLPSNATSRTIQNPSTTCDIRFTP